jgi:phosphate-selective porin OprO/OprP
MTPALHRRHVPWAARRRICRALAGVFLVVIASTAHADPAFTPTTANEKLLMDMLQQQQIQIRKLEAQVEHLSQPPARATAADASCASKADVEEVSTVLQNRVSQVEARTQDARVSMTGPGPKIESASGEFSVQVVGAIQADAAVYDQGDKGPATPALHGGTNIRRLHIGLQGTTFRSFNYALVYDASGTGNVTSGVRDALVSYVGLRPFALSLGQQKPGVGLEPNFSDRSNASTFMEPGPSAALITAAGTRAIGARVTAGGEHYSSSVGIFGDDITNNNIASPLTEGWGPAARFTVAPIQSPGRLLHLGVSGFWREVARSTGASSPSNPNFQLRYRAQPEVTVDSTRLVDTGVMNFAGSVGLLAVEGATVYGPFSIQGEWANSWVDQNGARPSLQFDGGYGMASWMLTGESRVYEARTGVFARFQPARNFTLGADGWGAFEIALRGGYLDLNGEPDAWAADNVTFLGARGGSEVDATLALNWYLNPWLRLMFNYVHADADNFTVPAMIGGGVDEGGDADVFAMRVHQEW